MLVVGEVVRIQIDGDGGVVPDVLPRVTELSRLTPRRPGLRHVFAANVELPWPEEPHVAVWHGITLLREWSEGGDLKCPVVIMSGHGTVDTAVEATRLGAADYLSKPFTDEELIEVVERAQQRKH